jgi:hypothetical protein
MKPLTLGNVTLHLPLTVKTDINYSYVYEADTCRICRVAWHAAATWDEDVTIANLFAASPDLLLAAEQVIAAYESEGDIIGYDIAMTNLRTAIARARGKES